MRWGVHHKGLNPCVGPSSSLLPIKDQMYSKMQRLTQHASYVFAWGVRAGCNIFVSLQGTTKKRWPSSPITALPTVT